MLDQKASEQHLGEEPSFPNTMVPKLKKSYDQEFLHLHLHWYLNDPVKYFLLPCIYFYLPLICHDTRNYQVLLVPTPTHPKSTSLKMN